MKKAINEAKERIKLNKKLFKKVEENKEFAKKFVLEHGGTDEELVPVRRNDCFKISLSYFFKKVKKLSYLKNF